MGDQIQVRVNEWADRRSLMLVWSDPLTGRKKTKSAGTTNRTKAERAAAVLQDELNTGRYRAVCKISWADFRRKYETERLAVLSQGAHGEHKTVFNHVERILNPDRLAKITTAAVSRLVGQLRAERMKESTLNTHLRHLKAELAWAKRMGLLATLPEVDMPRAGEAKARPVTPEEFDRLLAAVPKARPKDPGTWERFITGLWLSGLRLGEAVILSWEQDAPFAVDLSGRFPAFRIDAKAQKGRRDERLPMTPDFAEWLLQTPETERLGCVFKLPRLVDRQRLTTQRVGIAIAKIGKAARIVVAKDLETGRVKYATAHDLRRSFGTRWAKRVMPAVLQRLMRHESIGTTMRFYVGLQADEVAADLWAKHRAADISVDAVGNTSVTFPPNPPVFSVEN